MRGGRNEVRPEVDDYDFRMESNPNMPTRGHDNLLHRPAPKVKPGVSQNTGPKGVKKDYDDSKRAAKINRQMDEVRREHIIRQHVTGKRVYFINENNQVCGYKQRVDADGRVVDPHSRDPIPNTPTGHPISRHGGNHKQDLDENDDELQRMTKRRLEQLGQYREEFFEHQTELCGSYDRVDSVTQLSGVLKFAHPHGFTVLHLYDSENPCCQRLHMLFEDIAPMFSHVCFVRGRYEDIMPKFDRRFLPTLLIYKHTKLHKEEIGLATTVGLKPEVEYLVRILDEAGCLKVPTNGLDQPSEAERRQTFVAGLSDDDDDWLDAED